MRYVLAILCPPLGTLVCWRGIQTLINIPLTLLFYVPGLIHAMAVVNDFYNERRQKDLVRTIRR